MPAKIDGSVGYLEDNVNKKKCNKYINEYCYPGEVDLEDWQDESKFNFDELVYILEEITRIREDLLKQNNEALANEYMCLGASKVKLVPVYKRWYIYYLENLKEGEIVRNNTYKNGPSL